MIVQDLQKYRNKQVVPLCVQETEWTVHFQTQPHRVSTPEQFAK
jgi:hypothetical protein